MKAGIILFPGTNRERDMALALARVTGAKPAIIWHGESELPAGTDLVVLPGGFSYGDYLRCGAMAAQSPIMRAVADFAARGGHVLRGEQGEVGRALQVGGERLLPVGPPVGEAGGERGMRRVAAGIVDEHLDSAERGGHGGPEPGDLVGLAEVGGEDGVAGAGEGGASRRGGGEVLVVVHGDPDAAGGELGGDGAADAAGGAGDEGGGAGRHGGQPKRRCHTELLGHSMIVHTTMQLM